MSTLLWYGALDMSEMSEGRRTPVLRRGRVEADVRVNRDYAAVAASTYAVRSGLFAGNGFEPPVPLRMSSAAACLPKVAATLKATTGWVSRLGAKVPTC